MSSNVFQAPGDSVPPLGEGHAALADALDQGYCVAEVLLDGEGRPQDYRFVYVNHLFSEFTGISREDALSGKTAREIVPGLEDHWVQTYGNVALTGEPIQFEAGSEAMGRWFEVKAFRFGDAESRRIGILFADLTEQARARRAASQSEARYQALATASSDVAYGMSPDWSVMLPLDGRGLVASNEEPIQNWLEKNIPSSEHAAIREGIARAVASKSLFDMEHRVTRPDGSVGWTRSRAVPILDDAGNVVEWFGAASDITDRKRAEEELREGEERQAFLLALSDALRPLTEPADIAALAAERLGERFGMNRVFYAEIDGARMTVERDYARDVEPIVGKHDLSAFGPELLAEYRDGKIVTVDDVATDPRFGDEARAGLLSRKVAAYVDVILFRQEQSVGLLAVQSATPRKWTPSEQGLFQEVGERVRYAIERARAEASLRESEERFRDMADHAPMMVWVTEPDGSCSYLSQSWYEFTGQTPETGLGYGWVQATHPEDMEKAEREFVEANRDRRPFMVEYRLRRVDGQYRWAIDSAKPRFGPSGEYLGYVGSVIDITERKAAEEVLRQSEERFRLMADAVPQIVWITDSEGRAEFFNRQWSEYTGLAYMPKTAWEVASSVLHPDDAAVTAQRFTEALRTGSAFLVEHRIRSASGEYRWFLVRGEPYRDPMTGEVLRWFGASVDIHDRKTAEEALRQSEERLRHTQESLSLAMAGGRMGWWTQDLREDKVKWSPELERIFGLEEGSFNGSQQAFLDFVHPDDREPFRAIVARARQEQRDYASEFRFRRADGTEGWMEGRGQAVYDEAGTPVAAYGLGIDVTERRRAADALRTSESRLRLALETAHLGTWDHDVPTGVTTYDAAAAALFGRLRAPLALTTEELLPYVHPDDRGLVGERIRANLERGEPYFVRCRIVGDDGVIRWVESRGDLERDPEGRPLRVRGVALDVTEQVEAEKALRNANQGLERRVAERTEELTRANRDLDQFAYSVAHDLRAPLRSIVSSSRILIEDLEGRLSPEEQETLERQAKSGLRLARIVDDLLGFARLANAEVRRVSFDMTALTRETAAEVASRRDHGCEIAVQEGMSAEGDRNLLGYALTNLVDNACKFSPDGGLVTVGQADGAFFVRDHGVGFDMAHAHKLFVAFERLVGQEDFDGTGVGLANVKRIVERHGGRIWAESEPGKGATFYFTLG